MSLVSRLFSMFAKPAPHPPSTTTSGAPTVKPTTQQKVVGRNASLRDDFLELREPSFFGRAYQSPNKRWILGCSDSDGQGHGGCRDSGNGRVVLVDYATDSVSAVINSIARPFYAAVADNGTIAINDTGFGLELKSDVIIFAPNGDEQYRRHFEANLYSLGLSPCGKYLALQTCAAPTGPDDNLLEVHDLENRSILFSDNPSTEWTRQYEFDIMNGVLTRLVVGLPPLGHFSYSATGEFLDKQTYQEARLLRGDYGTKIIAGQQLLATSPSPAAAEMALRAASEALKDLTPDETKWAASAHRLRGEAFELLSRPAEAITAYELALVLDAKVGVKKKLAALKKKLAPLG